MTDQDPHSRAADAVHEGRPVEEQFVKGGRGGRRISVMMAIGIALTAVGFLILYLVFSPGFSEGTPQSGRQAVDSAAFQNSGVPAADAPTTTTGEPTSPPTGETPNVNAPTVQAAPSSN